MVDIDPRTGAPITPNSGSSSNITGGPNPTDSNLDFISKDTTSQASPSNTAQDNSARDKNTDPLLGTGTNTPKSDEASSGLSGDSQQNMRATDATSQTHSNTMTAGGSISDNRDNSNIDPATLNMTRSEGVTDRPTPMRRGATSADGTMLDFKTQDEPVIAGQHVTEKLNVPLDMAKDKAAILAEIQLVLRDGGMDSSSQIKSLERIASILHMNK